VKGHFRQTDNNVWISRAKLEQAICHGSDPAFRGTILPKKGVKYQAGEINTADVPFGSLIMQQPLGSNTEWLLFYHVK
jgi:hypothetical protein